jgi:hypothetical protein
MSFYKRYELVRLIREDAAKSFTGRAIQSGRPVLLHMVEGPEAAAMRPLVERARLAPGMPAILESGDFAGSYYVVTDLIEPFDGLRSWLEHRVSESPEAAKPGPSIARTEEALPPPPAARPRVAPEPDEFAAHFGAGTPTPKAEPEPSEFTLLFGSKEPAPQPPRPAAGPEGGEFTRLFGESGPVAGAESGEFSRLFGAPPLAAAPAAAPPPAAPPPLASVPPSTAPPFAAVPQPAVAPPAAVPPVAAAPEKGIGEFAKVFDAPPKPEPVPPPKQPEGPPLEAWPQYARPAAGTEAPAKKLDSGEFTRFFGESMPAEAMNVEAEQARHAQLNEEPDSRPFQQASEFTRQFGPGPGEAGRPIPPARPLQSTVTGPLASKIFRQDSVSAAMAGPPPASSPAPGSRPGEYTRMISGGAPADFRSNAAEAGWGTAASRPQAVWVKVLLVAAGLVGIVLLGFLFYLFLSRVAPR